MYITNYKTFNSTENIYVECVCVYVVRRGVKCEFSLVAQM
jgi:hypothetical protein